MEKTVQMSDLCRVITEGKIMLQAVYSEMYGEGGFKAVHKTVNLIKVAEHSFVGGQR